MTSTADANGAAARYERDGFLFPLTAMTPDEAHGYRQRIDAFRAANPTGRPFREVVKSKSHLVCLAVFEIVRRPELLDAVEAVLGPDILLWSTGLFLKEANDPAHVSWHQDARYWGLEPHDIVTAWLALTPATIESGAMRFVPGSHANGLLQHADTRAEHNMLARGQVVQDPVDEEAAVDVLLKPGQFSLHHGRLVHGSAPNRSPEPRYGVATLLAPQGRRVRIHPAHRISLCSHRHSPPPPYTNSKGSRCINDVGRGWLQVLEPAVRSPMRSASVARGEDSSAPPASNTSSGTATRRSWSSSQRGAVRTGARWPHAARSDGRMPYQLRTGR